MFWLYGCLDPARPECVSRNHAEFSSLCTYAVRSFVFLRNHREIARLYVRRSVLIRRWKNKSIFETRTSLIIPLKTIRRRVRCARALLFTSMYYYYANLFGPARDAYVILREKILIN